MPRLSRTFSMQLVSFTAALALLALSPFGARAQSIVAIVNGAPISSMDVQSRASLMKLTGAPADQRMILEGLIEERLKMLEARRVDMLPTDDEVEKAYSSIASNMKLNSDQFTKALASRGVQSATLKSRLRAEIGWNRFVREKFRATSKIQDQDVVAALTKRDPNKPAEPVKSESYKVSSVIFVLPKDAPPARVSQRQAEAVALRSRFKSCEEGFAFAKSLRDVAVLPAVTRSTAGMSPKVREILQNTPPGTLTPPERSSDGIELFAVCEKKEDTGSMALQSQVRQQLTSEGMEVEARRYINDLRARAVIEYR